MQRNHTYFMANTIFLGADHRGFRMKNRLVQHLQEQYSAKHIVDLGPEEMDPDDDYPDMAKVVGEAVAKHAHSVGILICGSGVGMAIAANKVRGVRATLAPDVWTAREAKKDDDANIIALASRRLTHDEARRVVNAFLQATFSDAQRYTRRIKKVSAMERE